MIGQHTGTLNGQPFVLGLSELDALPKAGAVFGQAYWEIHYEGSAYPWCPVWLDDECDIPQLLRDAEAHLRDVLAYGP
jgi:hypothetical protein